MLLFLGRIGSGMLTSGSAGGVFMYQWSHGIGTQTITNWPRQRGVDSVDRADPARMRGEGEKAPRNGQEVPK